jgi:hypothetical protein
MRPRVTLRQALDDPSLLGASLAGPSRHPWRSLLLAAMGEELKPDELTIFRKFTGRTTAPLRRIDEFWCAIGRRGGKSRAMAALAVYLAGLCEYKDKLVSANPDVEILNAVRPALATTGGPLIAISSPYARRGALWETYKKNYGPDGDPMILVAQGATRDFNPELPQSVIDRAMDRDPAAAAAEYLAQFRTDVEAFLTREAIEKCVQFSPLSILLAAQAMR